MRLLALFVVLSLVNFAECSHTNEKASPSSFYGNMAYNKNSYGKPYGGMTYAKKYGQKTYGIQYLPVYIQHPKVIGK